MPHRFSAADLPRLFAKIDDEPCRGRGQLQLAMC